MIPTALKLRQDQIDKVKAFRDSLKKYDEYDDASMASNIEFHLYATGLGDVITAHCQGKVCQLTIDDDGILID